MKRKKVSLASIYYHVSFINFYSLNISPANVSICTCITRKINPAVHTAAHPDSCLMQADNIHMLLGYSLCQQPDAEHLSILRRECHGPDVAHRLLNGTWLRSASHDHQSSSAPSHKDQPPIPPCDELVYVMHCYLSAVVIVFIYHKYPSRAFVCSLIKNKLGADY